VLRRFKTTVFQTTRVATSEFGFNETDEAFGRLDILVNNAAIIEFKPVGALLREHLYKQFEVNLLAPILAKASSFLSNLPASRP
jgi:NAD(P)-dependent dehydrogenase (short-subunit alcohol dehydrogenase family)